MGRERHKGESQHQHPSLMGGGHLNSIRAANTFSPSSDGREYKIRIIFRKEMIRIILQDAIARPLLEEGQGGGELK